MTKRSFFAVVFGWLMLTAWLLPNVAVVRCGELVVLTESNWSQFAPQGKEVDAIIGDFVVRNDRVWMVIARPVAGRNANMTVREVGAGIIDLTERDDANDQLSAFYPIASQYSFTDDSLVQIEIDGKQVVALDAPAVGKIIRWRCQSSAVNSRDGSLASVTYTVTDGSRWVDVDVEVSNPTAEPVTVRRQDSLRADGDFEFSAADDKKCVFAVDQFFRQAYGFETLDHQVSLGSRNSKTIDYVSSDGTSDLIIPANATADWHSRLTCACSEITLKSRHAMSGDSKLIEVATEMSGSMGLVEGAVISLARGDSEIGRVASNASGIARFEVPPGNYRLAIDATGYPPQVLAWTIGSEEPAVMKQVELGSPAALHAVVTEKDQGAIPCKLIFIGRQGTADPNFGPKYAAGSVGNVVYSANGNITRTLPPGEYEVWFCHGPEYDVEQFTIDVEHGETTELQVELTRSVDTRGWVSSDFHSHSSPSGDNTSSQEGRVLNLLAENIEFAPCTEHNRIDSYMPILESLRATRLMATCTGIELTGSPLPINHQNAFPLHHHAHHQDGGGPTTLAGPEAQIERLALWDFNSDKLVQANHPDIHQMLGDKDLDGQPDEGFRKMFGFMDVIEVHPPDGIFRFPTAAMSPQDRNLNPIFCWLQMLNLGYRIPGVVNTDAHYNFHGSGWLRNYMESTTDDPAKIDVMEMVHAAEHGHLVMTTGPFLQAELRNSDGSRRAGPGDDWNAAVDKPTTLYIRVQCSNWLDVNRVQVFANGRPLEKLNWTRREHSDYFSNGVVKFEAEIPLPVFEEDTHLIVGTIGEGLQLGAVMGPEFGKQPPVAVCNPIFIDIDGNGFHSNRDDLGVRLPGKTDDLLPVADKAENKQ